MDLVPAPRELDPQLGRDDAGAAMGGIAGDADLHGLRLPAERGRASRGPQPPASRAISHGPCRAAKPSGEQTRSWSPPCGKRLSRARRIFVTDSSCRRFHTVHQLPLQRLDLRARAGSPRRSRPPGARDRRTRPSLPRAGSSPRHASRSRANISGSPRAGARASCSRITTSASPASCRPLDPEAIQRLLRPSARGASRPISGRTAGGASRTPRRAGTPGPSRPPPTDRPRRPRSERDSPALTVSGARPGSRPRDAPGFP